MPSGKACRITMVCRKDEQIRALFLNSFWGNDGFLGSRLLSMLLVTMSFGKTKRQRLQFENLLRSNRAGRSAFLRGGRLFATVLLLLAGCRSSAYLAAKLPPQYRATANKNGKTINFADVSMFGVSNALISPSDLLEITLATGRDDEKPTPTLVRVAEDGTADIPVIGPVPVAGLEAIDASQRIAEAGIQRGMYLHPYVTLEIKSKAMNRITVLGAVENPGVHELPRGGSDLVSALAAAGGLTDEAGTEVEIVRQPTKGLAANGVPEANGKSGEILLADYQPGGIFSPPGTDAKLAAASMTAPQTLKVDLAGAQASGAADFHLSDRDVVMVQPRKVEIIHVAGLVQKPGQFELPPDQDIHLLDAIALAGGLNSPVADKVLIIRRVDGRPEPLVIRASLAKAKQNGLENIRLADGDTISIERTSATAIVDTIGKFLRFSIGLTGRTTVF